MTSFEEIHGAAAALTSRYFLGKPWLCFGPAFCVVLTIFTHYAFGYRRVLDDLSYADANCLASIACAAFYLVFFRSPLSKRARNLLVGSACVSVFAGFILMVNLDSFPLQAVPLVTALSAVLRGFYNVVILVLWFAFYAEQDIEVVACNLLTSLGLGCIISWFLLGMKPDRLFWGIGLIVTCSGVMLVMALESMKPPSTHPHPKKSTPLTTMFPPLLVAFLFSFALMLSVSFAGLESWHTDIEWSMLWPAAAVLTIVILFAKRVNIGALLYIALTLAVTGVLIASFLRVNPSFVCAIATMGFAAHISYMIILFCGIAPKASTRPERLGCLLILSVFGGCILGRPITILINGFGGSEPVQALLSIGLVAAIIACTLTCANNQAIQLYSNYRFSTSQERASSPSSAKNAMQEHAIRRGLGEREREALSLLLEGNTASQISDKMFIARGTAKAHIRHIYKKLDVHDREELFSLAKSVERNEMNDL